MEAWREELEPWEISTFEKGAGERLADYGYEPVGSDADVPPAQLRALLRQHRQLRRELQRTRRHDNRRRRDADTTVAALITVGQLTIAAEPVERPLRSRMRRRLRPVVRRARPLFEPRRLLVRQAEVVSRAQQSVEEIEET